MQTFHIRKLLLTFFIGFVASDARATDSTYTGPDLGNWGKAANWSPATVPANGGGMTFDVAITDLSVTLNINPTIDRLTLGGDSAALFSVDHSLISAETSVTPAGTLDFTAGATDVLMDAGNLADFTGTALTGGFYQFLAAEGHTATLRFNGADIRTNSAALHLKGAGARAEDESGNDAFANLALNTVDGDIELQNGQNLTTPGDFVNDGYFLYYAGTTLTVNGDLTNVGDRRDPGTVGYLDGLSRAGENSLIVVNGVLPNYDAATKTLNKGRFFFGSIDGALNTLQVLGGPLLDIVNNNAAVVLEGENTGFIDRNGDDAFRNLAMNSRVIQMGARSLTTAGDFTNIDSLVILGDSTFTVSGDLLNSGFLDVSTLNSYLLFSDVNFPLPIDPPAQNTELNVAGKLTLDAESTLAFEVFGDSPQAVINVAGTAAFDGMLTVTVLDDLGATVTGSDSLTVLTAASINGSFANVPSGRRVFAVKDSDFTPAGSFRATYDDNTLVLSEFLPHAGLLNLSSRALVRTGDNVAIAGFIIGGSDAKQILMRGIGPSLTAKGISGVLANPSLELFDAAGESIMTNDDWQQDQQAEIEATGIPPTDPKESALIATLDPGSYTVILRGVGETEGVGLVELYDLDQQPAFGELTNISTRGQVGAGENVLIGGIIVEEGEAGHLIVRALGPSLMDEGVSAGLLNPTLELYDSSGVQLAANDDWADDATQAAQIEAEGLAPTASRESALSVALEPGNYTAVVRSKENDVTGVALVEFYKLN
ncbi:MAG: hypothetical protein ACR2G0_00650 [Chthoniobacterales bacterium]